MECEFSPISFEHRRSRLKTRARCPFFSLPPSLPDLFVRPAPTSLSARDLAFARAFFFFYTSNAISAVNVGGSTDGRDYNGGARAAVRLMRSGKNRAFGLARQPDC